MNRNFVVGSEKGFTLAELLVSILILLPIMGAAISLFSLGAKQQSSGQSGIDANQEARVALEIMTTELAQAGSHPDIATTISTPGTGQISVASTAGFNVGDWIDVDVSPNDEIVQLTGVSATTLTAAFHAAHNAGAPVRLYALPYATGVIPPSGTAAGSIRTVTTLKFFGHIQGNNSDTSVNTPVIQYVEYAYDSTNNQITRSATPITATAKSPATTFLRNLRPNSVQFTLHTDHIGFVTSVDIALTARSSLKNGSQYQETPLSSKVMIPNAQSGSALAEEFRMYRGLYEVPPTPPIIGTWASMTGGY